MIVVLIDSQYIIKKNLLNTRILIVSPMEINKTRTKTSIQVGSLHIPVVVGTKYLKSFSYTTLVVLKA